MERGVGLVLLLTLGVSPVGASAQDTTAIPEDLRKTYGAFAADFTCTQVLGFSQSMEWYAGLSVVDHRAEGTRPDLSALAPDAWAADRGGITAGPAPKVASCDQFSDALGHLTVEGAEHVRRSLRDRYRPSTIAPEAQ